MDTFWLYFEPYIFVSEDSDCFFFYSTKTQKGISFHKTKLIEQIVGEMINIENLYSVKIKKEYFYDDCFFNFIKKIQLLGFGDVLEGDQEKPIIMPPILNLQRSIERLKLYNISLEEDVLSYLQEIIVYINGECTLNCKYCDKQFKQYLSCTKSDTMIDFLLLKNFLLSIAYAGVAITISGGNIFCYKKIQDLIDLLHEMRVKHTFVINLFNLLDHFSLLNLLSNDLSRLKIVVDVLSNIDLLLTVAKEIKQYNIIQLWEISIVDNKEYDIAEKLSEELTLMQIEVIIRPFYNGENIAFFEENVFMSESDFDILAVDKQHIFAQQELNMNNFGKIIILSDGKVYANVNQEPIGDIGDSFCEILCKELVSGISWRSTRYKIYPCSQCRFKLICPSPSNYELVIGQFNLCYVNRQRNDG